MITDLPSSPVIVWAMGIIGLLVHLTGKRSVAAENAAVARSESPRQRVELSGLDPGRELVLRPAVFVEHAWWAASDRSPSRE